MVHLAHRGAFQVPLRACAIVPQPDGTVYAAALGGSLEAELSLLLGQPWDDELEPFRHAAEGAPVRWLHATG